MGKKSKKGKSRAGSKARPPAGQGRSGSVVSLDDGASRSIASREDLSAALSFDSTPFEPHFDEEQAAKRRQVELLVAQELAKRKANDDAAKKLEDTEATPRVKNSAAKQDDSVIPTIPKTVETPSKHTEGIIEEVPQLVEETAPSGQNTEEMNGPNSNTTSNGNAINKTLQETNATINKESSTGQITEEIFKKKLRDEIASLAVLPVTPAKTEKSRDLPFPVHSDTSKTRGIIDLSQPAPEEAKGKQKDCECAIL